MDVQEWLLFQSSNLSLEGATSADLAEIEQIVKERMVNMNEYCCMLCAWMEWTNFVVDIFIFIDNDILVWIKWFCSLTIFSLWFAWFGLYFYFKILCSLSDKYYQHYSVVFIYLFFSFVYLEWCIGVMFCFLVEFV